MMHAHTPLATQLATLDTVSSKLQQRASALTQLLAQLQINTQQAAAKHSSSSSSSSSNDSTAATATSSTPAPLPTSTQPVTPALTLHHILLINNWLSQLSILLRAEQDVPPAACSAVQHMLQLIQSNALPTPHEQPTAAKSSLQTITPVPGIALAIPHDSTAVFANGVWQQKGQAAAADADELDELDDIPDFDETPLSPAVPRREGETLPDAGEQNYEELEADESVIDEHKLQLKKTSQTSALKNVVFEQGQWREPNGTVDESVDALDALDDFDSVDVAKEEALKKAERERGKHKQQQQSNKAASTVAHSHAAPAYQHARPGSLDADDLADLDEMDPLTSPKPSRSSPKKKNRYSLRKQLHDADADNEDWDAELEHALDSAPSSPAIASPGKTNKQHNNHSSTPHSPDTINSSSKSHGRQRSKASRRSLTFANNAAEERPDDLDDLDDFNSPTSSPSALSTPLTASSQSRASPPTSGSVGRHRRAFTGSAARKKRSIPEVDLSDLNTDSAASSMTLDADDLEAMQDDDSEEEQQKRAVRKSSYPQSTADRDMASVQLHEFEVTPELEAELMNVDATVKSSHSTASEPTAPAPLTDMLNAAQSFLSQSAQQFPQLQSLPHMQRVNQLLTSQLSKRDSAAVSPDTPQANKDTPLSPAAASTPATPNRSPNKKNRHHKNKSKGKH